MVSSTKERPVVACTDDGEFVRLKSEEAQAGMKVRVREDHSNPDLRGRIGRVEHIWGHPSYVALDVRLKNGRLALFWYYQLEKEER